MRSSISRTARNNWLIALLAAIAVIGIILGTFWPTENSTVTPAAVVEVEEDDPAFDCLTMGNRYCGDPDRAHVHEAWGAWDSTDGWTRLRVPTDRSFSVDYVGWGTQSPKLGDMEAAAPGKDGNWYVFRATFTD